MNKKGQSEAGKVGLFIMIALTAIVGLVLLTASAQNLSTYRNTATIANQSVSSANGTTITAGVLLSGQAIDESSIVMYNATTTGAFLITSGNWTINNRVVNNGVLNAYMNVSAIDIYTGENWLMSYTYEPYGYDTSAGGRAIAGIIIIFFALAISVVTLIPTLRSKVLEMMR